MKNKNERKESSMILLLTCFIYIVFTTWWIICYFVLNNTSLNDQFGSLYGLMALWGAILGIIISKKWGGIKTIVGKALLFFSLGLLLQEFGQISYSIYTHLLHIQIPYPSIGDIGYFGSIPLYILGTIYLAKASGVKVGLKSFESKIQAILIPALLLFFAYYFFMREYVVDWSQPLKVFLDFGYPFGQAIYISIALLTYLLSRKVLGGVMRPKIVFFIFALSVQFFSDYTFLYLASKQLAYPGSFNDFMYLTSYFLMTLALLQLKTAYNNLRHTG